MNEVKRTVLVLGGVVIFLLLLFAIGVAFFSYIEKNTGNVSPDVPCLIRDGEEICPRKRPSEVDAGGLFSNETLKRFLEEVRN